MKILLAGLLTLLVSLTATADTDKPYQGQEQRTIKALAPEEVEGYLQGKGMGYAKAAELNSYPGPKHVLDLADELNLSTEQRRQTEALFNDMQTQATALGRQLVEKEAALDLQFVNEEIDSDSLQALVAEIGAIEAKIRAAHLQAHLAQRKILDKSQINHYNQLRGYQGDNGSGGHSGHQHSH